MKITTLMGILILIVFLAGCSQAEQKETKAASTTSVQKTVQAEKAVESSQYPMSVTVNIYSSEFRPGEVTIAKGGTVKWINKDTTDHTVLGDTFPMPTSMSPQTSGRLQPGESWKKCFDIEGYFSYADMYDENFKGKVVVK